MTRKELALDKLKYWGLISRARKIGFKIPKHWMKYGEAPTNASEILAISMDAFFSDVIAIFDRDDSFYKMFKK